MVALPEEHGQGGALWPAAQRRGRGLEGGAAHPEGGGSGGSFLLDGDVSLFLEKRLFLLGRLVLALLCLMAQTEPKNHDQNKSRR